MGACSRSCSAREGWRKWVGRDTDTEISISISISMAMAVAVAPRRKRERETSEQNVTDVSVFFRPSVATSRKKRSTALRCSLSWPDFNVATSFLSR